MLQTYCGPSGWPTDDLPMEHPSITFGGAKIDIPILLCLNIFDDHGQQWKNDESHVNPASSPKLSSCFHLFNVLPSLKPNFTHFFSHLFLHMNYAKSSQLTYNLRLFVVAISPGGMINSGSLSDLLAPTIRERKSERPRGHPNGGRDGPWGQSEMFSWEMFGISWDISH